MTESPFPFIGQSSTLNDEPAGDSRRNVIALGAVAAVVFGGGAFFLLSGGSDTVEDVAFTPSGARAAAAAASPAPQVKLPVATKVAIGRNPFKALYVQPVAAAAAPAPAVAPVAPVAPVTTPVSTAPVGRPIVVVGNGGAPAPAPAAPVRAESTVSLTGVSTKGGAVGRFVYDGAKLSGKVGDVMGGKLKLISLQQDATGKWFANLRLGDGGPFEVFQGQTVVVQ